MLRKLFLKKARYRWQIQNENGDVISERKCFTKEEAIDWCNAFLSSFNEVFDVRIESDERETTSKKT